MLRRLTILAIGVSVLTTTASAQRGPEPPADRQTVDLAGRVVDGATGKTIPGATLVVDTVVIATTDRAGMFVALGVDPYALVVIASRGYDPVTSSALEVTGEIVLLPEGLAKEIIDVRGEPPPAAPGASRLDREELERLPGTGGDLLAALDVMPGVTSTSGFDAASGIVIRGSAPQDSRILFDGFDVPLLYHSLAQRSILPTAAIAGIDYLPGGFDVSYGRASSGIVAVTTRGGTARAGGQAEVALIDGGVVGYGPAGSASTVLVSIRRSVIDLALPSLLPDGLDLTLTTVPRYWDGVLRVDTKLTSRWRASLSAIGSTDTLELFTDNETDPDARFYNDTRFLRLTGAATYYRPGLSATIAASGLWQSSTLEVGSASYADVQRQSGAVRSEVTSTHAKGLGLSNVEGRAGFELDVSRNVLDLRLPRLPREGEPMAGMPDASNPTSRFDGTVWNPDIGAWVAVAADFDPKIRTTIGTRVDGFTRSGNVAIQPRAEIAVRPSGTVKLRLVAGAYRRPAENRDENLDDTLAPERATQLVIGVEHGGATGLKLQGSAYYTDRSSLVTRTAMGTYANQGRGTTYGAELLATYRKGAWFAWFSYAYSRSTRVDAPGAERRLFDYDQPHDLNVVVSWKGKRWQVGGRFRYASGNPDTEVVDAIYASDADRFDPVYGTTNGIRLPAHHQLDLRVDRTWRVGKVRLSAFLDIQNVYANAQVVAYTYNFDYSERTAFSGLPLFPSIGLRGEL